MNEVIDEIMMEYLGMDFEEASNTARGSYLNAYRDAEGMTPFVSPSLIANIVKEIVEAMEE
tara:strand:- start:30938 stop:31120 length:183 start_codon:yes stop_codon:yes gene_type:complete